MPRVAVAIGSNLGDRAAHLAFAVSHLATILSNLSVSRAYETAPVDMPPDAPSFLNAGTVGDASMSARELLEALQRIEQAAGRERPFVNAPRTLDLDLILYGDHMIAEPGLTVPHPRFRNRRFVLEPLNEIAPDLVDPVSGCTIADLLARCR